VSGLARTIHEKEPVATRVTLRALQGHVVEIRKVRPKSKTGSSELNSVHLLPPPPRRVHLATVERNKSIRLQTRFENDGTVSFWMHMKEIATNCGDG
jgi:hypothetical protein